MMWGFALVPGVYFWRRTSQTRYHGRTAAIFLFHQGKGYFARCCGAVPPEYALGCRPFYIRDVRKLQFSGQLPLKEACFAAVRQETAGPVRDPAGFSNTSIVCIKNCLKTKYSPVRLIELETWIGTSLLYCKCKQPISNDEP
jgi:hypothetical protein